MICANEVGRQLHVFLASVLMLLVCLAAWKASLSALLRRRSRATLARGFQNSRACRFPQLRKPFTELFLAVQTLVLLMNVPDRKFYPIPATHAVKYIAQVVANRVRRDSHEPGDVPVCEAGCNKHGDGELAGCQHIYEGEFLSSSFGSHVAPSPLAAGWCRRVDCLGLEFLGVCSGRMSDLFSS